MTEGKEGLGSGPGEPAAPPIMRTLGMRLVTFGEGKALVTTKVDSRFHNPMGTLHGGIMTDLADASMGMATMSTLGRDDSFTTLELKMNFLRPTVEGGLAAEAKVVHRGKTVALTEVVVRNKDGKEEARGMATQMTVERTVRVTRR